MSALGSLVVQLAMDYAQYQSGWDKTEQETLSRTKRIQEAVDGVKSTAAQFALGIGASLAAVFSVEAMKNMINGITASQVELKKLSEVAGVSVEKLSGIAHIAKQSGTDVDQLTDSMNQLTQKMVETKKESDPAAVALQKIGINFKEFRDLKPDEQFLTLAKSLDNFEDGAGKSAAIMAIMGEEGAKLLPFMKDLAAAGDIQAKVTAAQVEESVQYQRSLQASQASNEALKTEVVNGMVPALNLASRAYNQVMNGTGGVRDEVRNLAADGSIKDWTTLAVKALSYVIDAGQYVWRTFQSIGKGLGGLAASAMAVSDGDFKGAFSILQQSGQDMIDAFKGETWGEKYRAAIEQLATSAGTATAATQKQTLAVKDFVAASDEGAKATDREGQAYTTLMGSINAKIEALKQEATTGRQLTESEKELIKVMQAQLDPKKKLTDEHYKMVKARIAEWTEIEKTSAATKKEQESLEDARQARMKNISEMENSVKSLADGNKALKEEIELIGKNDQQRLAILRNRNLETIAIKEAHAAELAREADATGTMSRELAVLQSEIELLQERNGLLDTKQIAEGAAKGAEATQKSWQSLYENVSQSLTDALMNGGMDAKGYLKGLLRSLFVQPFVMNIVANVLGGGGMMGGLGSMLGMGGSGGGGLGGLMNLGSAANTGYGLYSGSTFTTAGGMMTSAGDYMGWNWLSNAGATVGGWGAASAAPYAAYGANYAAPATLGVVNVPGAASSPLAGMGPAGWAAAAVIIAAYLGGMFKDEKQVGQGITGELGGKLYGYQLMRESGGLFDGPDYRYVVAEQEKEKSRAEIERLKKEIADNPDDKRNGYREMQIQRQYSRLDMLEQYNGSIDAMSGPIKMLQDSFTAMREDTASRADSLGLDGDSVRKMKVTLGLDEIHPDTGGKGIDLSGLSQEEAAAKIEAALAQANEEMARSVLGKWEEQTRDITRMVWDTVDVVSDGDTQQQARVGREVTETVTEQVFVMGEYVRVGETAVAALNRLSSSLAGVNMVFDLLGTTLLEGSLSAADWASKLVDAMGSMDALTQAASTYYDLYYSEEEKRTRVAQQANKGMEEKGLDLRVGDSDAKAKYRALVDKAIADKDEEMLAWLLKFADDFAAGADAASASLQQARDELVARMQELIQIREETLSTLGLSMDGLVDGFINEINEGRGAQAGEWLADSIAAGFEQAIYRQAVTTILNSIIDGVITPVVTAAMAGSSVTGLVSGAAIDSMVANAKAAAAALKTLLSDPAFKAMLDETIDFVRDLGNDLGSVIPPMSTYTPAVKDVVKGYDSATKAADDAAAAAKKLADQWRKTIDSMLAEMERLRSELLGAADDQGAAYYEALFAIKTAQARAGDQDAADELPVIIRNLEALAKANASSQSDVHLKQAEWLASLTDTRNYLAGKYGVDIGNQQKADAAAATAAPLIQSTGGAAFSSALQTSSDNQLLVSELRALRVALQNHDGNRKSEAAAMIPGMQQMNKTLRKWDYDGLPATREEEVEA